jgi:hypothetical protein
VAPQLFFSLLLELLRSWSDPTLYFMTDNLLTKVEESETWRQAFGFVKTSSKANSGQGKKNQEHYIDLATKLFHDTNSPKEWLDVDIRELGTVVKNRIAK